MNDRRVNRFKIRIVVRRSAPRTKFRMTADISSDYLMWTIPLSRMCLPFGVGITKRDSAQVEPTVRDHVISLPLPLQRAPATASCMHARSLNGFTCWTWIYNFYASNIAEIQKLPLSGRLQEINDVNRARD